MRGPNAVDFWRGFALSTIFINHIPGIIFERISFREYSLSDSAELFVFLAGVSLRFLVRALQREPLSAAVYRLAGRALTIYFAQLVITSLAIAITAGAAKMLDQPAILQWNNAAAVFEDPIDAHIGLALLRYQLGYFNILPLYVVLMALAPSIAIIDRLSPWLLPPLSAGLYVFTLATGWNLPTWPVEGSWYFSPFAWQFIFVLGFYLSGPNGYARWPEGLKKALFWLAALQALAGGLATWLDVSPDPALLPQAQLFFLFDKTFLTPPRLIHALALVRLFLGAFPYVLRATPWLAEYFALLGRNSLQVFCAGSLLSLTGQMARYAFDGRLAIDVVVLLMGLSCLGFVAWLTEWRKRHGARRSAQLSA